ncbi:hypothetical protein [Belnapia rosea]|nr:hypothetical protein [Belnapia rosea]
MRIIEVACKPRPNILAALVEIALGQLQMIASSTAKAHRPAGR